MEKRPYYFFHVLGLAASAGVLIGLLLYLRSDLPQVEELIYHETSPGIRIFSANGTPISRNLPGLQSHVPYSELPKKMIWAILAAEDHRFFHHVGLDLEGLARAMLKNIVSARFVQGGSTITQQLAKVLFLTPERSIRRKFREAMLAIQIERRFSKEQILEIYLNSIYLGRGATGIAAAAQTYFGKTLVQLSLGEMAFIASLPKAPTAFSSDEHRARVLRRRDSIINSMVNMGVITPTEAEIAKESSLQFAKSDGDNESTSYFLDAVYSELARLKETGILSEKEIRRGIDVKTTLDLKLQKESARSIQLAFSDRRSKNEEDGPQASLVVIENDSGAVRALQGGTDYLSSPFNRAFYGKRQVGSAFKPFIYAVAIENGWTQLSRIWDSPMEYTFRLGDERKIWKPENYDKAYLGLTTLREALAQSKNLASIHLVEALGIANVKRFLESTFFPTLTIPPELTVALGVMEIPLLELTNSYRVFANSGLGSERFFISQVASANGEIIYVHPTRPERVISPETAFVMVDMLRGVVKEGTAWRARSLDCDVGVKTGTTNDYRDAYYIGITPRYSLGVWVGRDDNRSLGEGETGSSAAGPIWVDFAEKICSDTHFLRPPGVTEISASIRTGGSCANGKPVIIKASDSVEEKCPDLMPPIEEAPGEFVYYY